MPKNFSFLRQHNHHKETLWDYSCELVFNGKRIVRLTITDHYQIKHKKVVTNDLICELALRLDKKRMEPEPQDNPDDRDVFVRNFLLASGKKYRLIFWFHDSEPDHLWIRNCYPID